MAESRLPPVHILVTPLGSTVDIIQAPLDKWKPEVIYAFTSMEESIQRVEENLRFAWNINCGPNGPPEVRKICIEEPWLGNTIQDVMEAFICALFLDQNETKFYSDVVNKLENLRLIGPGWQIANAFIESLFEEVIDFEELLEKEENYKEQLLQYYQKEFKITPQYISISVEGPPHMRIFTEGVISKDGSIVGRGIGKKKQDAQQLASKDALKYFGLIQ